MRLNLFASAFIGAASVLTAAEAMAQCTTKSIPLPDAALLTPPPGSSCAFQIVSLNAAPSQLDYERQCHRDAGVILRDRLLQLQALVGVTVKAINRVCPAAVSTAQPGSKPSIPLPRRALLTPPPGIDCTFKESSDAGPWSNLGGEYLADGPIGSMEDNALCTGRLYRVVQIR